MSLSLQFHLLLILIEGPHRKHFTMPCMWASAALPMSPTQRKYAQSTKSHLEDLLVIVESLSRVLHRHGLIPEMSPAMYTPSGIDPNCKVVLTNPSSVKTLQTSIQVTPAQASFDPPEMLSVLSNVLDNDIDWDILLESVSETNTPPVPQMQDKTSRKRKSCNDEAYVCCVEPMKWKKYAQKRVADGDDRQAILKQSYKCTVAHCNSIKVTSRNTGRDGPSGPLSYEFYGTHTHDILPELQTLMGASTSQVFPAYTGGRLKRKNKRATTASHSEATCIDNIMQCMPMVF